MEYQSVELADFSGGITDYPFKAPLNKYEELDNIILDPNNKPLQRPGSTPFIQDLPELPVIGTRIHNVTSMGDKLYVAQDDHIYYQNNANTAWVDLLGVSSVVPFNATAAGVKSSFAEWNGHLFVTNTEFCLPFKIFKDNTGTPQIRTAGLPNMASSFSIATSAPGATFSWVYYVVYVYSYQVENTTFRDVSYCEVDSSNVITSASATPTNTISNIPVLANAGGSSYDLGSVTKEIYRTIAGGTVAYFVASISNATTSYPDNIAVNTDTLIQANPTLDQTTGTRPYDPPPRAKFIHIMNGRGYYAYTQDPNTTEEFPTRVFQSIQDDPDSVPADFFVDVRDEIKGISSYGDRVIVFGNTKIYRIDGYYDELGRNGPTYEEISKVTGCVSQNSIVQTEQGVFFAGNSGFYFTNGYEVKKISDSMNERYKETVAANTDLIYGCYDPVNLRVYWAAAIDGGTGENDIIYCLDLRQGIKQDSTFTTWSNEEYFKPTAITVFNKQLIRADARGYVFRHDDTISNDPRIDTTKAYIDWDTKAIVWSIKTSHMDFGFPQIRKWVARILVTFRNLSDLSVQVYSINDDQATENPLKEIRFRTLNVWGSPTPIWGTASDVWNQTGLAEQYRRFPANGLRCSYKQVHLTNAFTIVYRSDDVGICDVDYGTKIVTLTNLVRYITCPFVSIFNCSSITGVLVGDTVVGTVTGATGVVTAINGLDIELYTVTGNFAGETDITTTLPVPGATAVISSITGPSSPIASFSVGDTILGLTTAATGTIEEITPYTLKITTTSGDFTGETRIQNTGNLDEAPVTDVSVGQWPDDLLDFSFQLQPTGIMDNSYPVTLNILQRIDPFNILLDDPDNLLGNYLAPPFGFIGCKWYIVGVPKNEYMNMQSMVLYYAPIGPSQKTFQDPIADTGANEP